MISNLLTSLLIATAVGGTTATAFGNEPSKATSESREQYQITVTENILNEGYNMDAYDDYGEAAPYYQTTQQINDWTLNSNYWFHGAGYYSENKWEVENRTYINLTSLDRDNYNSDNCDVDYVCYESLSITKVLTYVDLISIDTNNVNRLSRKVVQDQDENEVSVAEGSQSIEVRTAENQNNTIDSYLIGQTPPSDAYQSNSIAVMYNNIKSASTLKNTDTMSYDEADEDYLGSDHLDFSYNYNTIMQCNYIIKYVRWESSYIEWYTNQDGRPNYDIKTQLINIGNNIDITYSQLVYIDSQGGTTPVVTQEIIDIPSLMYTVMTMPFAFISQAFNLTLFPNTPYQVNFANIFLVILALLIILFVVKLIMRFIR